MVNGFPGNFALLADGIYVCGGHSDDPVKYLRSCERYEAKLKMWFEIPAMFQFRGYHACVSLNGKISMFVQDVNVYEIFTGIEINLSRPELVLSRARWIRD